jgi:hypothetical protein
MNGSMRCGPPLIPAPVAFCALMFGFMLGLMIGRHRSMMHGMDTDEGRCGGGWMMRKKMMDMMGTHHHHGHGMPQCTCGESSDVVGEEHEPVAAE